MRYNEIELVCLKRIIKKATFSSLNILSDLLDLELNINKELITSVETLQNYFDPKDQFVFIHSNILGPAEGDLMLMLHYSIAGFMVDSILGMDLERPDINECDELMEFDKKTLYEISKVMNNNFIKKFSDLINCSGGISIPEIFLGTFRKTPFPASIKKEIVVINEFQIIGVEKPIGFYFMMPNSNALKLMFHACSYFFKKFD